MNNEYIDELLEILNSSLPDSIKKEKILQYHESDIADLIQQLDKQNRIKLYNILGKDVVAEIVAYIDDVDEILEELDKEYIADIIELMDADDAIDVLEDIDEDQREEIVALVDKEVLQDIKDIVKYDDDLIGSKMTNNYITITTKDTVKTAMRKVISDAANNDNVSIIFVLDENERFFGVLELRDLIIARPNDDLNKIIKQNYPYFYANEYVEDCLERLKDYDLESFPILDENDALLGIITSADVIEAVDEEMAEDYAKLAGLTDEDELDDSVFSSVKKRIPWLVVLLVLGLIQSFCMTGFEQIVGMLPIIIFFQTSVLAMAGNSGTQALAVTIRSLSTLENGNKQIIKTIFKELRIAILNGLLLSILAFTFVFLFLIISKKSVVENGVFNYPDTIKAALIVSGALFISMSVSGCVGTFIPIFFMKIKIDPAVASGPFITTINDVTALLIYYGLAYVMFNSLF